MASDLYGLGKTPWVDRTLAKILEKIERETDPTYAPILIDDTFATRGRKSALPVFQEYGCGHYGCVLPTRTPDVVLKVTSDESEAWFIAHVVRGRQDETDGLVRYLQVRRVVGAEYRNRDVYVLWREAATELGGLVQAETRERDAYRKGALQEAANRIRTILAAGRVIRAYYDEAESPDEWFARLDRATQFESRGYAMAVEMVDASVSEINARFAAGMRGNVSFKLATALSLFQVTAEMMANEPGATMVGHALETYFDRGFVLCDVHLGNVGKRLGDTGWSAWIITDPGHAVPLRRDLLRVTIRDL